MRHKIIISFLLSLSFSTICGQITKRGIQIGEEVPDVVMDKIVQVNGSVKSGRISDYRNQLLILDFMYTSCSSCVEGLVKKDHLQRLFGDKIKIMAVVGGEGHSPGMLQRENSAFIRNYLRSVNYLSVHQVNIPWIVENKDLNNYFPHINVSHLVWIYKGKLVAVTEQDYVTAVNIQLILDGKKNEWPVKNDFLPPINIVTPLVEQSPLHFNRVIAKNENAAAFGTYQDGFYTRHGSVVDSVRHSRRDYHINIPIINLYRMYWLKATGIAKYLQPSQIILEVKNPESYIVQEDSKQYNYVTRQKTLISLEVTGPDTLKTEQERAVHMLKELDRLLGLKGRYEKRKMKCLVLYRIDSTFKFISQSVSREPFTSSSTMAPSINFRKDKIRNVVYKMNQFYGNPLVFDETDYDGLIDMVFSLSSWMDIPAVNTALNDYGLGLRAEEREVEVFVLTESNNSPLRNL